MSIWTREFFVGQKFFGSAPAPMEQVHEQKQIPHGEAFFCPICAEVWGRAVIVNQPTTVRHRACEKHTPGSHYGNSSLGSVSPWEIPGSLFLDESRAWNQSLPDEVWRRELRLHIKWLSEQTNEIVVASIAKDMLPFI